MAELPPGAAAVNVTPVQKGGGTFVDVLPANPESDDFGVHCDESDFFCFSFGKVSGWEWPYERRYRPTQALKYNLGSIESGEDTRIARGQRLIALGLLLPQLSAEISETVQQLAFTPTCRLPTFHDK